MFHIEGSVSWTGHANGTSSRSWAHTICFGAILCFGCEDEPLIGAKGQQPPSGEGGPAVAIQGQRLEAGFVLGHLRKSLELGSFRISKHPVTFGEYGACVNAGGCDAAHGKACLAEFEQAAATKDNPGGPAASENIAACVRLQGARQYCAWVGGRLPTFEQWLLAARGPVPQRYPWGSGSATCQQHPRGARTGGADCPRHQSALATVGQHPAGASSLGVQDVLLTGGELLDTSEDGMFTVCKSKDKKPEEDRACLVYGLDPGAIDAVLEIRTVSGRAESAVAAHGAGFRCAWGGAS